MEVLEETIPVAEETIPAAPLGKRVRIREDVPDLSTKMGNLD